MSDQLVDRKGPYTKGFRPRKFFELKKEMIHKKLQSSSRYNKNIKLMSKLRSKYDAYPSKEYAFYYSIFIIFALIIGVSL
jgi:hypothetical protein